jgi:serine/threonine protein kinase
MIPYTAKCDLFSIGVMAFELVYGSFPWSNRAGDE